MKNKWGILLALLTLAIMGSGRTASAQDWFKTGTGLGVSKARVAAPDLAGTPDTAKLESTFHNVLWNDLEYSGILDMVSQSFYPLKVPTQPGDLPSEAAAWAAAPAKT